MTPLNRTGVPRGSFSSGRLSGPKGFTLVELMFAVALAQLVLLGLVIIYASSSRYFNTLFYQHYYKQNMLFTVQTIKNDMDLASRIDRPVSLRTDSVSTSTITSDQDFVLAGAMNVAPSPDNCYPIDANDTLNPPSLFLYCVKQNSDKSLVVYRSSAALTNLVTSSLGKVDCRCAAICAMRTNATSNSFNGCGCDKSPALFDTALYPAVFKSDRMDVLNNCGSGMVAVSTVLYTAYFSYNLAAQDKVGVSLGVMQFPGVIMGNYFKEAEASGITNNARLPFSAAVSREFKVLSYGQTPCDIATGYESSACKR